MNFIICLTSDPASCPPFGAPVVLGLSSHIDRFAAHKRSTFDASIFACERSGARMFKGMASAHQWLRRNSVVPRNWHPTMLTEMAGSTTLGVFNRWSIIHIPA